MTNRPEAVASLRDARSRSSPAARPSQPRRLLPCSTPEERVTCSLNERALSTHCASVPCGRVSGRPIPHASPPAPREDPSDACDMRHSARNPHSARFRGSVHHPDRGMPAAASGTAAPSPPSAFGQWNVVSLLPLSWAPVSARGQAWISRWRRGAPPVVPPRPPAGGRAQPRAAQPAGWPAGDRRGRAESSRTATHLAHPRRPRNEGCSLFNATPCGALGDAASLWSQLADAAWTGLRPQWRD